MSYIGYKKLFNINVTHDFSKNGYSPEFSIIPTLECSKLLKNLRMLYTKTAYGFKLSYQSNNTGTALLDNLDQTFLFTINPKNGTDILNITDLSVNDVKYTGNRILFFTNDPVDVKNINHEFIDYLKPRQFVYCFPFKADDPDADTASLEVLNSQGTTILGPYTSIVPDKDGYYRQKIELLYAPKGKYTFRVSDSNNGQQDQVIYIDNDLARQQVLGLVEISNITGCLDEYELSFSKMEAYWKYYIVNKSGMVDLHSYNLRIRDTSRAKVGPYRRNYPFSKGPEPDPVTRINDYDTIIFTSRHKIPFYEEPLLDIELQKIESGGSDDSMVVLVKHLPNPARNSIINENDEIEIYVFI